MSLENNIVRKIQSYEGELLNFVKNLISIPTENPPGRSYEKCAELITEKLKQTGLDYELIKVPVSETSPGQEKLEPRFCIQSFYGPGKRTVYFHGHYDVVPATHPDLFMPVIKKGNLYGRGSSDMKSGLAVMIYAVKALIDCGVNLNGRIGLTFVPDEETGGKFGSQYLLKSGKLGKNGIAMLTPEPSSGVIWNANRGAISMRITINGKPAHVGLHYKGINSFELMTEVVNSLFKLREEIEKRKTSFKIKAEKAKSSILLIGGESLGGSNFNVVPENFTFTLDRRINPEEDLQTEKDRIIEILEYHKAEGIDLAYDIFQEGLSSGTEEDNPVAKQIVESTKAIINKTPAFEICPGLLENRFYAAKNIPSFAYGPGLLTVSHGPNEFIKIKDVFDFTSIYALVAAKLLSN